MLPTENVTRRANGPAASGAANASTTSRSGPVRVVLDTNTVLDWLVFGDAQATAVGAAISSGGLTWLATPRMHAELRAVLSRPLPSRWERARELALTIDVARLSVVCPEPALAGQPLVCSDATDQVFIDLARQHSPAVLLTRDRALLALRRRAATLGVVVATAAAWQPLMGAAISGATVPPK